MHKQGTDWAHAVNAIMYGAIFSPSLMPQVERLMGNMPARNSREWWTAAIRTALATSDSLATDTWPQHSDAQIRQLLAEIERRLVAGRPYGFNQGSVHS